jgi:predicted RNase H-like HicB family nuclease
LVESWLARGYTRQISFVPDETGGYWLAWVPQFGRHSLAAAGDTPEEALADLKDALETGFTMLAEAGEVPDPPVEELVGRDAASGKLTLRLPPNLHARLQVEAEVAGLSLNAYLVSRLEQVASEERLRRIVREELAAALAAAETPAPTLKTA